MGDPCLMWFKRGLWFLLCYVCECLLRWNKLRFAVLFLPFVIPIPFKTTLLSPFKTFKSLSVILLAHYLLFYLYTLYVPMCLCILFMLCYMVFTV